MNARTLGLTLGLWLAASPAFAEDPPPALPPAPVTASEPPLAIPAEQPAPPPPGALAVPAPGQPGPVLGARTYSQGYADGRSAAERESMGGWFATGAAGGCMASGLGCLAATGAGALIEPRYNPAYHQDSGQAEQRDYWSGYEEGYAKRLKARRATSAFIGGTVATAATGVILIGAMSGVLFAPIYLN